MYVCVTERQTKSRKEGGGEGRVTGESEGRKDLMCLSTPSPL